jgi:hypothetical protein
MGLDNDTEDVESSDDASVLGNLALSVVEVGGDDEDGVCDFLYEVSFSGLSHLGQNPDGMLTVLLDPSQNKRSRKRISIPSNLPKTETSDLQGKPGVSP